MIRSAILKITVISLLLMMGAVSCGDNSTGTDPGEPPEIPEITAAQPDFSYFTQAKEKNELLEEHAFDNAQNVAWTAEGLFAFGQFYTFFGMADGEEPDFEDGNWVWTYSISSDGETVEFKLTADINESANEVNWAYYITYTGGEQDFQDYKFMEGTTSLDGSSGNWKVNDFEAGTTNTVLSYEWDTSDDGNISATFNFHDEDITSSIEYVQDGTAHTLTMKGYTYNDGNDLEIYWDTEADHGYWWDKGSHEKLCWNSDKNNIACSDIGL